MRTALAFAVFLVSASPSLSEEPHGCGGFKWPLTQEQAALNAANVAGAPAGATLDRAATTAAAMSLLSFPDAQLAMPPERAPKKPASFAGMLLFAAGASGRYRVTLSSGGWIDVIQNGAYLKPVDFTGALDCPGVRKSVEFSLGTEPFTLQVSDVAEPVMRVVLTQPH